jgi:hypothetical protein
MLETYFSASKALRYLRGGPSGPYLDLFAIALERQGYSADTAVRYLRAAAHLGHGIARRGIMSSNIDLTVFSKHLRTCRCPRAKGGRGNHHTIFGARLFRLSPAPRQNWCLPGRGYHVASRAGLSGALQRVTAQASQRVRSYYQARCPRRRPPGRGARRRSRAIGTCYYSQLLFGTREPLRQWERRKIDDQSARVLAPSCYHKALPCSSRRRRSRLCPLVAFRFAAISGDGG